MIHQNTKWYHLGFAPKWVWFFSWYRDFRSNRNSWALWLQVSICVCMTVKSQKEVSSKYSVAPLFKYGNEELKMQKRQFFNMVHSKNQPKCPTRSFLDVSIFVHHPKNLPTLSVAFLSGPVVRSIVLFKSGPRVGRIGPSSFTWNVLARRVGTVGQESSESSANAGIFASPQLGLGTVILRISPVMITIIIYYIITMITIVLSSGQELVQLYLWGLFFFNFHTGVNHGLRIIWLVVYLPLWNIWSQLGWWNSQYMENKSCSKPPTSYDYGYNILVIPFPCWLS